MTHINDAGHLLVLHCLTWAQGRSLTMSRSINEVSLMTGAYMKQQPNILSYKTMDRRCHTATLRRCFQGCQRIVSIVLLRKKVLRSGGSMQQNRGFLLSRRESLWTLYWSHQNEVSPCLIVKYGATQILCYRAVSALTVSLSVTNGYSNFSTANMNVFNHSGANLSTCNTLILLILKP